MCRWVGQSGDVEIWRKDGKMATVNMAVEEGQRDNRDQKHVPGSISYIFLYIVQYSDHQQKYSRAVEV